MKRFVRRAIEYSIGALLFFGVVSIGVLPARACLNDRDSDSLAEEARGLPDVVQVIVGRFPRNPPLFYQMRIARVQHEIAARPRNFSLYDDISVAYDRLGDDNAALRWIETKRHLLPRFDAKNHVFKEVWYRYYANAGTFRVHRWLHAGANRKTIGEVVAARNAIRRAIEIKPNAHFGREKYQLAAMEWMIGLAQKKDDNDWDRTGTFLTAKDFAQPRLAIEGLSGLVVLGNAWESLDVFNALRMALGRNDKATLEMLARLRCKELIAAGKISLSSALGDATESQLAFIERTRPKAPPVFPDDIAKAFHALRAEAETWQKARTNYMMARLKRGLHPDTDKRFWIEYSNAPPPSLERFTPESKWRRYYTAHSFNIWINALPLAFLLLVFALIFNKVRRAIKGRGTVAK